MAPLYSRYVPPKPAQPQDDARVEIPAPATPQKDAPEDPSHGRKKRKRNEVDDSDRKAPKHAKSRAPEDETPKEPVVEAEEEAVKKSSDKDKDAKKEKKNKKETKDRKEEKNREDKAHVTGEENGASLADAGDDDAVPGKHTKVLSKYQKAAERSAVIQATAGPKHDEEDDEHQPELHDLVPLPQRQRESTPEYAPTFSALPDWLAHPIVVSQSTTKPFGELSLSSKAVAQLESKGWTSAFAVQCALLPLLLPHPYLTHLPANDICVSAPTGSGKTLGYVLPIIESLRNKADTKLRAVIVVPTRELVQQAHQVAMACAAGTRLRIAVAVGNQNLATEQESLIKKGRKYDPEGYRKLMDKAKRRIRHEEDDDDEDVEHLTNAAATAAKNAVLADVVHILPDHVPTYTSAIDILICAPGRLVEHMNSTVGFNLDHVEWLVVDEADRLLDQTFQEWVPKVVGALEVTKPDPRREVMDQAMASSLFRQKKDRYVRKVILSATMTRDIAKLSALRLRRPSLVQVKSGEDQDEEDMESVRGTAVDGATVYGLPRLLREFAVPVGDGLDKPLFLLQLLKTRILSGDVPTKKPVSSDDDSSSDSSDSSDSDSDSDSDSSSDESSSDSSDSDSDSDSDSSDSSSSSSTSSTSSKSSRTITTTTTTSSKPKILVFTNSTEEASRLHHLLTHLEPTYAPQTTLLTKTSTTLKPTNPTSSPFSLIISTDRASRGLDIPDLSHVINYSMPRSVPTYVHRVGRTARANRAGQAWTLFQEKEGRWFWRDVVRGEGNGGERVERAVEVERVNLRLDGDEFEVGGEVRVGYESVLGGMKEMVEGAGGKRKNARRDGDGDVVMKK